MHNGVTTAPALAALSSVSVSIGTTRLLDDVTFSIQAGERVALLGANGAGKTTLMRVLHGLTRPSSGSVQAPHATAQAMLFQKPLLLRRSVLENVTFALEARGRDRVRAMQQAYEHLEQCGLRAFADRYARTLSGGEQQRLALARAMACRPALLLADEPTASLAPKAVFDVEALISSACRSDTALVIATHNRGQAKRLATRIVFMSEGRIVEDRPADDFFSSPASQEAIDYLNVERI